MHTMTRIRFYRILVNAHERHASRHTTDRKRVETYVPTLFLYIAGHPLSTLKREFELEHRTCRTWVREWRSWMLEEVLKGGGERRKIGGHGVQVQVAGGAPQRTGKCTMDEVC